MLEELLGNFPKVSKAEWEEKIIADLKGKPFDDLLWKAEGIEGGPTYTAEDLQSIANSGTIQSSPLENVRILGPRNWVNYQQINVEDEQQANKIALDALNLGADGLYFQLSATPNLSKLLDGIQLEYCTVSFQLEGGTDTFLSAYSDYIQSQGYDTRSIIGFLTCKDQSSTELLPTTALPSFKTVNIVLPDSLTSANIVEELASLLHLATTQIAARVEGGLKIEDIFSKLNFQLSLGDNYFTEIAKLRAMRILAQSLLKGFGLEVKTADISILSASGNWDNEVEDEYNYLLKGTMNAMAAIIGGCNALLLRPFDSTFKDQPKLASRMARNISSMLKDESYLDKVIDPSAGSYFIETITNQLIESSWVLFLKLEQQPNDVLNQDKLNDLTSKLKTS